ncbi:unnamed protein product [Amoebophrya sp. A25]|nr:unnamed protein product [Amoebophrya sp. A25]|eukprot:GSA25T00025572001.1
MRCRLSMSEPPMQRSKRERVNPTQVPSPGRRLLELINRRLRRKIDRMEHMLDYNSKHLRDLENQLEQHEKQAWNTISPPAAKEVLDIAPFDNDDHIDISTKWVGLKRMRIDEYALN